MTRNILFIQPTITHRAGIDMVLYPVIKSLSQIKSDNSQDSVLQYKVYTLSAYENYNKENKSNIIDFDNGAINITMNENIDKVSNSSLFSKIFKMFSRAYFIYKIIKENNIDFVIASSDGLAISSIMAGIFVRHSVKFYAYMHENIKKDMIDYQK